MGVLPHELRDSSMQVGLPGLEIHLLRNDRVKLVFKSQDVGRASWSAGDCEDVCEWVHMHAQLGGDDIFERLRVTSQTITRMAKLGVWTH